MSHGANEHVGDPNPLISWLFTTNHKNVGVLYLVTSLYFLVVAGVLAMTFRLQLSQPNNVILGPDAYNRAITLHGLFMLPRGA
jgi:cytochrome c oxidase subunit I+III